MERGNTMTSLRAFRTASIVAIACAIAAPAFAQATSGSELEELVVTARKREERLTDIPVAATAIGPQELKDMGGLANAQQLLSNVPGVNFANTANSLTSDVSIRGSGTSRATNA